MESEKLKSLFNHSKIGIAFIDAPTQKYINVNNRFSNILEYTQTELLQMTYKDITHEDDILRDKEIHESSISKKKEGYVLEKRYISKSGEVIYCELFVEHIYNSDKELDYSIFMINDVSKKKKIDDSLIEQTKTMQLYLDIIDVMIIALDNKGTITLANEKACSVLGYEEYELLGRNWFKNFFSKKDEEKFIQYFNKIISGDLNKNEKHVVQIKSNKKGLRTLSFSNSLIKKDKKEILGAVFSGEDITEILKLEEEKRKSEKALFNQTKLASMGEMLRNIAHQWRQPLSSISTAASGLIIQQELDILKKEDLEKNMEMIVNTTQHLSQTINDFQNYFKTDGQEKSFTCESLFINLKNLLSSNLKSNEIEFILEDKTSNTPIIGFFNELLQILINIINNSVDAFRENKLENKAVFISGELKNKYFYIEVKDNALGIPPKILNKIFEPYFTTKHQSIGTGIGLYMVKDIIENRLQGFVEVKNKSIIHKDEKRKGAVFLLKIPVS